MHKLVGCIHNSHHRMTLISTKWILLHTHNKYLNGLIVNLELVRKDEARLKKIIFNNARNRLLRGNDQHSGC